MIFNILTDSKTEKQNVEVPLLLFTMVSRIVLIDLMHIINDNKADMLYVSAEKIQCDSAK
jgi:hypothetical protein